MTGSAWQKGGHIRGDHRMYFNVKATSQLMISVKGENASFWTWLPSFPCMQQGWKAGPVKAACHPYKAPSRNSAFINDVSNRAAGVMDLSGKVHCR